MKGVPCCTNISSELTNPIQKNLVNLVQQLSKTKIKVPIPKTINKRKYNRPIMLNLFVDLSA